MAINFPSSPSVDDTYTYLDQTWICTSADPVIWERSTATETGNTEGNTFEVAYYDTKGSIIKGATAFYYDSTNLKVGIGISGPDQTLGVSGDFNVSGGATFGGDVRIRNAGDVALYILADTDNVTETDNPLIRLSQDNDYHALDIGIGEFQADTPYFDTSADLSIDFGTDGTKRMQIEGTGSNGSGQIVFYGGISADVGATFGGAINANGGITTDGVLYAVSGATFSDDVHFGRNVLWLDTNTAFNDGSGNPIFKVNGDMHIDIGDVDANGNDTSILIRDSDETIIISADANLELGSDSIKVGRVGNNEIVHATDSDTKIVFYGSGGNKIDFIAGGVTFAGSTMCGGSNLVQMLYAPMGLTVGYAAGGAFGAGNIYTPYGVTCGSLEVGGYWAGEQSDYVGIAIDNGTSVITTGKKAHRIIPWDCEVIEWTISSADTGLIQWDVNWCTYTDWPSTASVGGSGLPGIAISPSAKNQDTSVNWAKTTFDAGNIIEFEVDSVTSLTNCILSVKIRRTG